MLSSPPAALSTLPEIHVGREHVFLGQTYERLGAGWRRRRLPLVVVVVVAAAVVIATTSTNQTCRRRYYAIAECMQHYIMRGHDVTE